MNKIKFILLGFAIFMAGCSSTSDFFKDISPFKKEEASLEPKKGVQPSGAQKNEDIFVCAGNIDVAYKKLGEVSLGEFGFSGHDILALKIKEKAFAVGGQGVINVQYDTGASKSWQGYGELGGTDYGVKHTSWCKGTAIVFLESHNSLGLMLCNLTNENKEWFGYKNSQNGAIVVNVIPRSIAANAGIKTEDLITEWNGEKIENKNHLENLIQTTAGKEAKLSLLREKEIKQVTLLVPATERKRTTPPAYKTTAKEKPSSVESKSVAASKEAGSDAADVHNEIGDLYLKKGMYDDAILEYKKAIDADPNCAIAHFNLSIVYGKVGMKEEADEEYIIYKRLKPKRK